MEPLQKSNSFVEYKDTKIKGIPWSELKEKLLDPNFDSEAFQKTLTYEEYWMLHYLENAAEMIPKEEETYP